MKMFLDSGAFSIWKEFDKSGRVLEGKALWDYVDAYANYIKQNIKLIDVYVNVDIPFRPDVTLEVQKYMEKKHKLHPIPVYHPGEPVKYLIDYVKKYDYIGMGGIGAGNISKQAWMTGTGERAFEIICDNPKKMPKVKVHGFAMTSPALMMRYPFFSVDSVVGESMVLVRDFGRIRVSSMEELYWSALGGRVKTKYGHFYKTTPGLEVYLTDDDGKGLWSPVSKVHRHEVFKNLYEVGSFGGRKLTLTDDHGCFVVRDNRRECVRTTEIETITDRVIGINYKNNEYNKRTSLTVSVNRRAAEKTSDPKAKNTTSPFPFKVEFTPRLMEFIGLWFADGFCVGNAVGMSCANDKECYEVIKEVTASFDFKDIKYNTDIEKNGVDCRISNAFFVRVLKELGCVGNSHTKEVPWWVFELPEYLLCAFLRGYFSGDGSTCGGRAVVCHTVSKKLHYGIYYLLSSIGINFTVSSKKGRIGGFSVEDSELFGINIGTNKYKLLFLKKIGFLQKRKNEAIPKSISEQKINMSKKMDDFFSEVNEELHLRCNKVQKKGLHKGYVYDLEVPGLERYNANGLLIHNSSSWMQFGKYGLLIVPKKKGKNFVYNESPHIVVVSQRKKARKDADHFNNLPKIHQDHIREYVKMKGYKFGKSDLEIVPHDRTKCEIPISDTEVSANEIIIEKGVANYGPWRDELNMMFYLDLAKHLPKWPWSWKPKDKFSSFRLEGDN